MRLGTEHHLTYCTNIHPGEHWNEVFASLQQHTLPVKRHVSPEAPFGLGLRLSDVASRELLEGALLTHLKGWLAEHGIYVFTMNGFPYGGFHRQVVKDTVHRPDWTTTDRRDYTQRLFDILAQLLPEDMEGGISTSPISYKYWYSGADEHARAVLAGTRHLAEVALHLHEIEQRTGKWLHLDIEPEPDGSLENTQDVLAFYRDQMLPIGIDMFRERFAYDDHKARECVLRYIQICYDVCHFAVAYESPQEVFTALKHAGIGIGKIQISAALKADLPTDKSERARVRTAFEAFNESTYLHQVIARTSSGRLEQYRDLHHALKEIDRADVEEWRTHFHVPIFEKQYQHLHSTQGAILAVLSQVRQEGITRHLEVETYTWEVLPEDLRSDLNQSICRELDWVLQNYG